MKLSGLHRIGDGPGCRELHLLVDAAGPDIEEAPEDAGEPEHVVDLVRIVGSACSHDPDERRGFLRRNLRIGVGKGKDHGVFCHPPDVVGCDEVRRGEADEHVGALHGVGNAPLHLPRVRHFCQLSLVGVHAALPARVQGSGPVAHDDVPNTRGEEDLRDRRACGTRADHHDLELFEVPLQEPGNIDERGQGDHGGAVLVIVEHGDVEQFSEPAFNRKAVRRGKILQVDAAEGWGKIFHRHDDLVHVLGGEHDRESIDAAELLEDHGLAFHHRQRSIGTDIAEAQDRGAVGHDGHGIAFHGIAVGMLRMLMDVHADPRHARSVDLGQIVPVAHRQLVPDLDLASFVGEKGAVRDPDDLDAGNGLDGLYDGLFMLLVPGVDRDVPDDLALFHPHDVHGAEVSVGARYGCGDLREHADFILDFNPDADAVAGAATEAGRAKVGHVFSPPLLL